MLRACIALVALVIPLVASATPTEETTDPTRSVACRKALDALQSAEAASAPPAGAAARLKPLRQRAAQACLGGRAGLPSAQRTLQAPIRVDPAPAPAAVLPPAAVRAAPPVPEVNPPRPVLPPTVVLRCDSTQCWASDGSVLQRAGTALIGPRGMCQVQGHQLVCP